VYQDTEEVRAKLLAQHMRPFWEVWLWDAEAVLYGGWYPLHDTEGHQRVYDHAEALAGLRLARKTYGPEAVLKFMAWTVAEEVNV
jgi:hypothetical protein